MIEEEACTTSLLYETIQKNIFVFFMENCKIAIKNVITFCVSFNLFTIVEVLDILNHF